MVPELPGPYGHGIVTCSTFDVPIELVALTDTPVIPAVKFVLVEVLVPVLVEVVVAVVVVVVFAGLCEKVKGTSTVNWPPELCEAPL